MHFLFRFCKLPVVEGQHSAARRNPNTNPNTNQNMSTNHTPGYWTRAAGDFTKIIASENAGSTKARVIARVATQEGAVDFNHKETLANACLIEAAPDLLAALEKLAGHCGHYASMPHAHSDAWKDVAEAHAAIKKAKGGAS